MLLNVEIQVNWVDAPKIVKSNNWGLSKGFSREDWPLMWAAPEQTCMRETKRKGKKPNGIVMFVFASWLP